MAERVDEPGAALAGSQLQTQLYVNRRAGQLNDALFQRFPELAGAVIEWRSPLASDGYREYWDRRFLDRVGLSDHAARLNAFWPTGGPHWDALAAISQPQSARPGVLLVEGKSYPKELYGSGCQAKPRSMSRTLIEKSLAWTQRGFRVADRTPTDWCGPLYQTANRLAHLQWLRSVGVRAWLVHLLFTDDPHGATTEAEWMRALERADEELGLTQPVAHAGHVLLPSGTREELIGEATRPENGAPSEA